MGNINLDSTRPFCFSRHLSLSNAPKETNGRKEKRGFFSWVCCPLKTVHLSASQLVSHLIHSEQTEFGGNASEVWYNSCMQLAPCLDFLPLCVFLTSLRVELVYFNAKKVLALLQGDKRCTLKNNIVSGSGFEGCLLIPFTYMQIGSSK